MEKTLKEQPSNPQRASSIGDRRFPQFLRSLMLPARFLLHHTDHFT